MLVPAGAAGAAPASTQVTRPLPAPASIPRQDSDSFSRCKHLLRPCDRSGVQLLSRCLFIAEECSLIPAFQLGSPHDVPCGTFSPHACAEHQKEGRAVIGQTPRRVQAIGRRGRRGLAALIPHSCRDWACLHSRMGCCEEERRDEGGDSLSCEAANHAGPPWQKAPPVWGHKCDRCRGPAGMARIDRSGLIGGNVAGWVKGL